MKKALIFVGIITVSVFKSQLYSPNGAASVTNGSTTNVGVGTSTPSERFTVMGAHTSSTILLHSIGNGTDTGKADLMLWASEPGNTYSGVGISNNVRNYDAAATPSSMVRVNNARGGSYIRLLDNSMNFNLMSNTGVKSQVMTILSNGNVGIGTNKVNPVAKLDIDGGINITNGSAFQISSADVNHGIKYKPKHADNITLLDGPFIYGFSGGALGYKNGTTESAVLSWNNTGNVGIGTSKPTSKLEVLGKSSFSDNMKVEGKIEAKEIKVTTTPTADFVFSEDYNLPKLEEVEKFVTEKKHLPEIASAKEMEKEGVNVGEFQIKLLQKIEELTLYSIDQNKQLKSQSEKIFELEKQLQELKSKNK